MNWNPEYAELTFRNELEYWNFVVFGIWPQVY